MRKSIFNPRFITQAEESGKISWMFATRHALDMTFMQATGW
jgi:uncharacterized membrane protein (UPF0127 family)